MGMLEDLKKVNPSVKIPVTSGGQRSILDELQKANPNVIGHIGGGYGIQEKLDQALAQRDTSIKEQNTQTPWNANIVGAWKAGVTDYKRKEQSWSGMLTGEPVKVAGDAFAKSTEENANRIQHSFDNYFGNPNTTWADTIHNLSNLGYGIVNSAFSVAGSALQGAETIPILGSAAEIFNRLVAASGAFGSKSGDIVLEQMVGPFVTPDTLEKLRPVFEDTGGLLGIIKGMKVAGKYSGKISESKFVKPKIESINEKFAEIADFLVNDPKIKSQFGQSMSGAQDFINKHGPVRDVPITSETPGSTQIPATPNQKHAVYAKSQGYEPIVPDSQLPSISIGDTAPSKELPTIDYTTGEMRDGTADVGQYQMSLNEAPKVKTSTLLEENRNNPKTDTPTTTEKPKEPTYLSEEYHNMLVEMELSEKGYRYPRGEHDATQSESQWQGVSSTFPDWVPSKLRLTSLFDKFLKDRTGTTEDLNIQYKKGSRLDRLQQAFIENLKFLEEQNRKERETKQLMEEANAEIERQRTKEDAASAEAEYAKMQGGSPVQDSVPTGNQELMQPVASEGKAMTPALTKNAVERLSKDMQQQFATSNVPMYNKASWTGIANKVIAEFNADPAYAMDIAMGRIKLEHDSGMTQTAFWVEAMHRAEQAGDAQMMLDLSRSKVSGFATAAGQEIGYLANLEEGNPVILIKKINDSLKESYKNAKKGDPEKRVINEIDTIEKFIKESTLPKEKWIEVIKGIKDC